MATQRSRGPQRALVAAGEGAQAGARRAGLLRLSRRRTRRFGRRHEVGGHPPARSAVQRCLLHRLLRRSERCGELVEVELKQARVVAVDLDATGEIAAEGTAVFAVPSRVRLVLVRQGPEVDLVGADHDHVQRDRSDDAEGARQAVAHDEHDHGTDDSEHDLGLDDQDRASWLATLAQVLAEAELVEQGAHGEPIAHPVRARGGIDAEDLFHGLPPVGSGGLPG